MIVDQYLRVSTAQAVTTTAVSTDKVDLSIARDIGAGNDLYMYFTIPTAFAGGTSIQFQAVVADDAALSTNVTVVGSSAVVALASLTAGTRIAVRINPQVGSQGRRYLGANYVVVGTMTAGAVTADIADDIADNKTYASGFSVT
jgi:hypothetical protein